jgi:hypothetical protein
MSLTLFGEQLETLVRQQSDKWEITEVSGEHPLDKIITIRTPGFEMPEAARKHIQELAYIHAPAAFRNTFIYKAS